MTSIPALIMVSLGIKAHRFGVMLLASLCATVAMSHQLREGDLLFTCSDVPNVITRVTSGTDSLPIDHVGIVHRIGGSAGPLFVIEAVKPMVCLTPIDSFLCRNTSDVVPQVIVGRVNVECDMARSVRCCLMMVGKPYDDLYLPGDSAIYCSELVQMNYVTIAGEAVFAPIPMSFHDRTGRILDEWIDFYSRHGMQVPEGEPGSNPGELSCRRQVTIIGLYPLLL